MTRNRATAFLLAFSLLPNVVGATGPSLTLDDRIATELHALIAGDDPAVLEHGAMQIVPYGLATPILTCSRLRTCTIQLATDERLLSTARGDKNRWHLRQLEGPGGSYVLAIKPTDCALTTNLVVSTTRRIYDVVLDSTPCDDGDSVNPTGTWSHLRFYYPDDFVETYRSARIAEREKEEARREETPPHQLAASHTELSFSYRWKKPRGRFPWQPTVVFDDGTHTVIKLPANATQAPVVLAIDHEGKDQLVNSTRPDPHTILVDGVFDTLALILGPKQRLTIRRNVSR